ncbi:MAG: GNAT family N-acetyltransferase [Chloroflexi bacterium]|nr:MAG: GNAT family N-acetyltransferase [Chloroflexota bacterium]
MRVRPFDRDRDLAAVLGLVSRMRARGDPGAIFHPGGLQWWLRRLGRTGFEIAVRSEGDDVLGLALRDGCDVIVQADSAHLADLVELLEWVESRARETHEPEIFVSIAEDDDALRGVALSRKYQPSERYGYELVYELAAEPPSASLLPAGFEMISLTPALTDAYVELHRAAWSRPNAPSTYDRRQHDLVTAMPDFRYDLVPIVATSLGTLGAYCMSWWDPRSSAVEIEPLGTHPDFRRKGLATAIVHEVLRRSWALGAKYVLVWGTSGNPEAKALYLSAGLRIRRVLRDHRLALGS